MPIQKNVSISLLPTVPKTQGRAKCFKKNNLDWFALLGAFCHQLTIVTLYRLRIFQI